MLSYSWEKNILTEEGSGKKNYEHNGNTIWCLCAHYLHTFCHLVIFKRKGCCRFFQIYNVHFCVPFSGFNTKVTSCAASWYANGVPDVYCYWMLMIGSWSRTTIVHFFFSGFLFLWGLGEGNFPLGLLSFGVFPFCLLFDHSHLVYLMKFYD